ncbi:enhancer of mRNA-decapping protein 3 [Procambarus clarkii]|uniref:enhancer of mRNA-decapping protein 3 n=1 Tax=Procambarus clarkii TaxID=6728 RepID=UPI001E678411|nr:enhancer of mRNA-decapping protein 3-like [Procambarus clarkii]XP_045615873.1 enhancer of mRNA-decapping protein 3-like [Procambarus clarkii]
MCSDYVGCVVSVQVGGGLGWYQGRVVSINIERQTITVTRVLHNGRPAALSEVTINAGDIIDLQILSRPTIGSEDDHKQKINSKQGQHVQQTVQPQTPSRQQQPQKPKDGTEQQCTSHQKVLKNSPQQQAIAAAEVVQPASSVNEVQQIRRKPRTSVGETLAHGPHSSSTRESAGDWQRMNQASAGQEYSSPRRIDRYSNDLSKTPGKKERMRRARDETTFGTPVDEDLLATEFDFEKNLALFDKQAVIEEIQSLKPDVVRQADRYTEKKYRCDENVLPSKPPVKRQIIVPTSGAAEVIYANDTGLLVPSVSSELRAALLSTANQHGLTNSRLLEMIGRATTELILSLSGGSHRLGTGNSQQQPIVVLLCGCHLQGAAGVNAARQLESHGVQTIVVTHQVLVSPPPPLLLTHELQLYALTNGRTTSDPRGIVSAIDLIVDARLDHCGRAGEGGSGQAWLNSTTAWASSCRAPILALDPPSDLAAIPSTLPPLPARVLLCPSLPLAYTPARGKVYLINLPIPQQTFSAVGITYVSPFGAKLVIPLHPCE